MLNVMRFIEYVERVRICTKNCSFGNEKLNKFCRLHHMRNGF